MNHSHIALGAFPTQGPLRVILSNQEAHSNLLYHNSCSPHQFISCSKNEVSAPRTRSVFIKWKTFDGPYGLCPGHPFHLGMGYPSGGQRVKIDTQEVQDKSYGATVGRISLLAT